MSFLYPGEYIDSTYSIDFDKLYKDRATGALFLISTTPFRLMVRLGAMSGAIALFKHLPELVFRALCSQTTKSHEELCYKLG